MQRFMDLRTPKSRNQATVESTSAETPSSSLLTVIFVVAPVFAEYAIFTIAATLPPVMVLPYSLMVWVLVERVTSVPSSG